jgi:hypothetical protein
MESILDDIISYFHFGIIAKYIPSVVNKEYLVGNMVVKGRSRTLCFILVMLAHRATSVGIAIS